jgi:Ca2+-binding RTX toxin-like protein
LLADNRFVLGGYGNDILNGDEDNDLQYGGKGNDQVFVFLC